jgi:hypothetical protein
VRADQLNRPPSAGPQPLSVRSDTSTWASTRSAFPSAHRSRRGRSLVQELTPRRDQRSRSASSRVRHSIPAWLRSVGRHPGGPLGRERGTNGRDDPGRRLTRVGLGLAGILPEGLQLRVAGCRSAEVDGHERLVDQPLRVPRISWRGTGSPARIVSTASRPQPPAKTEDGRSAGARPRTTGRNSNPPPPAGSAGGAGWCGRPRSVDGSDARAVARRWAIGRPRTRGRRRAQRPGQGRPAGGRPRR